MQESAAQRSRLPAPGAFPLDWLSLPDPLPGKGGAGSCAGLSPPSVHLSAPECRTAQGGGPGAGGTGGVPLPDPPPTPGAAPRNRKATRGAPGSQHSLRRLGTFVRERVRCRRQLAEGVSLSPQVRGPYQPWHVGTRGDGFPKIRERMEFQTPGIERTLCQVAQPSTLVCPLFSRAVPLRQKKMCFGEPRKESFRGVGAT
jgi:hypothetical protein